MPKGNPDKSTPKPGDYSIGSLRSRAAARAMIGTMKEDRTLRGIQIINVSPDGTRTEGERIEIPPV